MVGKRHEGNGAGRILGVREKEVENEFDEDEEDEDEKR